MTLKYRNITFNCKMWMTAIDPILIQNIGGHLVDQFRSEYWENKPAPDESPNFSVSIPNTNPTLLNCLFNEIDETQNYGQDPQISSNDPSRQVDTERVNCIVDLPNILFIDLNRTGYDEYAKRDDKSFKIKRRVPFERKLNLNHLVYHRNDTDQFFCAKNDKNMKYNHYSVDGPYKYVLRGILLHYGESFVGAGGHYTSLVVDNKSDWYLCDDSKITPQTDTAYRQYFGGTECYYVVAFVQEGMENKYIISDENASNNIEDECDMDHGNTSNTNNNIEDESDIDIDHGNNSLDNGDDSNQSNDVSVDNDIDQPSRKSNKR